MISVDFALQTMYEDTRIDHCIMTVVVYFRIVWCYLGFLIDYVSSDKFASVNQTEPEEDYESAITRMYSHPFIHYTLSFINIHTVFLCFVLLWL